MGTANAEESFRLKWNDYHSSITQTFNDLRCSSVDEVVCVQSAGPGYRKLHLADRHDCELDNPAFFSLDVEGSEPMVLRTIDFEQVDIKVLMVEVVNTHCREVCESRNETRAIMKAAGYRRYEDIIPSSDVYVKPGSGYELPGRSFSD